MNIVFMGTPDFAVPVLEQLVKDGYNVVGVVTQPDKPKGRKQQLTPPPVKVTAQSYGIPVLQPTKIREREQYEQVLALQPDLIVTAAFGQILPKPLLDAPKYGCINVHASLLPELRGGAPIHYAILQGKEKTGITIMYMVEKLDAGDILTQVEVPIDERDTVGTLHDKLSEAGAKLLSETIPKLLRGDITPIKQDDAKATFAYNIKPEQERIDWEKDGEDIYNHIRGMNPWPVAYTTYGGERWKIWWGEKVPAPSPAKPGTMIAVEKDGIIVATGNGTAIKITELQPAGKRKMSATDFLRGTTIEIGTVLGGANE
ncbi:MULTISPECIES: methionyl-tRNA formyltransferase [Anoxybacillus]|jgi:methionyl-tRNA formyltransferase|uniref:Methionyl-tRNA formyltransferase n=1 Tax=Anoxybacillus flavithermus AK1 TaxID=1297581 RepID=M8D7W4_9BACL|nr:MULTISPECIES: methionyl-tRNA formyltransferase [Anoxybacillus]EMT46952.1 methionyl-tRNA formyltransferase [Anoxybacillus flavithermus AK1]MBW7650228.1 methionyl-tRNA formyltransferase [Anoxybacillus sp. ST4]